MDKFDINTQYGFYLEKMNMVEESMLPIQVTETKRAFYGAWGIMLALMKNELADLSENEAINVLEDMVNQVAEFFDGEVKSQFGG